MKSIRIFSFILILLHAITRFPSTAQNWCGTDEVLKSYVPEDYFETVPAAQLSSTTENRAPFKALFIIPETASAYSKRILPPLFEKVNARLGKILRTDPLSNTRFDRKDCSAPVT